MTTYRLYQDRHSTFRVDVRGDGRRRRLALKDRDGKPLKNRKEAERQIALLRSRTLLPPNAPVERPSQGLRLSEFQGLCRQHLETRGHAPTTCKNWLDSLILLREAAGDRFISEFDMIANIRDGVHGRAAQLLNAYCHYLKVERGIRESTINTRLSAIGAAFSFAVAQGYMSELGRPKLPRYRLPKRKPAFWTKEEFLQVLAAAREYGLRSPRTYKGDEIEAALRIGYLSGLRPGEVLGLRVRDVDFEHETITVRVQARVDRPKDREERSVPLNETLAGFLKDWIAARGLVSEFTMRRFFRDCWNRREGVTRGTAHKVRHTFATHFMWEGNSVVDLQEILGHSKLETTQIYAHSAPAHRRAAVNKLSLPEASLPVRPASRVRERWRGYCGAHLGHTGARRRPKLLITNARGWGGRTRTYESHAISYG